MARLEEKEISKVTTAPQRDKELLNLTSFSLSIKTGVMSDSSRKQTARTFNYLSGNGRTVLTSWWRHRLTIDGRPTYRDFF